MKAAVYYENGGPEVFRVEDVPRPTCAPDGVLIKVSSISIEGGDQISRETVPPVNTPHIVGYQCAGEILEVGSEVRDRLVGQRVVCIVSWGSHAEYVAAPAAMTWPLPPSLDVELASAVPVAFATANECLFAVGNLQKGQSVLIHGGSGALGLAAIQMAVHAGSSVFTTSSDDAKLERLKSYGPVVTINNVRENFVEVIRAKTGGVGIDLVIDSIAGKTLPLSVATLKFGGRAIFVGVSGRDLAGFDPFALWPNCTSLHGVYMPRAFEADYVRNHAVVADCLDKVARGELKVDIDRVFSLSDVVSAYEYLQSRKGFGRVLLRP